MTRAIEALFRQKIVGVSPLRETSQTLRMVINSIIIDTIIIVVIIIIFIVINIILLLFLFLTCTAYGAVTNVCLEAQEQ